MAVTHRVRYIAPAALVSLLCASAAPAQTAAPQKVVPATSLGFTAGLLLIANGAKWGLGIGVGLFALAIAGCEECRPTSAGEYAITAFAGGLYGAMGTGIGVGIDALKHGEQTIYRRPGLSASVRF